jgi:hypothetical protein
MPRLIYRAVVPLMMMMMMMMMMMTMMLNCRILQPKEVFEWLALLLRIGEVLDSTFSPESVYPL